MTAYEIEMLAQHVYHLTPISDGPSYESEITTMIAYMKAVPSWTWPMLIQRARVVENSFRDATGEIANRKIADRRVLVELQPRIPSVPVNAVYYRRL